MDWYAKEHDPADEPRDLSCYSRSQRRQVLKYILACDLLRNPPEPTAESTDEESDPEYDEVMTKLSGLRRRVEDPRGPLRLRLCDRDQMLDFVKASAGSQRQFPRRVVLDGSASYLRDEDLAFLASFVLEDPWLCANTVKILLSANRLTRACLPDVARLLKACPKLEYATLAENNITRAEFDSLAALVPACTFRLVETFS